MRLNEVKAVFSLSCAEAAAGSRKKTENKGFIYSAGFCLSHRNRHKNRHALVSPLP